MDPRDPDYITPFAKLLLKQRSRLLRTYQLGKANDLALRINSIINVHRRSRLNNMRDASSRDLWAAVKPSGGYSCKLNCSAETANHFFSRTSYDMFDHSLSYPSNNYTSVRATSSSFMDGSDFLGPYVIEQMLRSLRAVLSNLSDNMGH